MREITLNLNKKNVESILMNLMKLRQKVNSGEMETSDELTAKFNYSLSNTGYILENIRQQCLHDDSESSPVSMDVDSYVNMCTILFDAINEISENIIRLLMLGNEAVANSYIADKEELEDLYKKIISERFENAHSVF
jgi:hypothetical protein